MKVHIIAAGFLKSGPEKDLFDQYAKRLSCSLKITEINSKLSKKAVVDAYQKALSEKDIVVLMDEGGENISSRSFAQKIKMMTETGKSISFIIGCADGIPEEIKQLSYSSISFGKVTWPHLLARVLLVEQLYRVQQILSNHPYHRD